MVKNNRYDNLLMIYYSGTGNSKRVSGWIAETAAGAGLKTVVTSFSDYSPELIQGFTGRTLIGFFSATHGFNMPHSMLRFLFRFHDLKGADIFIGNTRAGMKLSKLFMPGLSGLAMYFPALIMLLKGYKIRSMYPVDLPSNWISLHPGLKPKVIDSMFDHYRALTRRYAEKILAGKRVFLKSFMLLPLDILVAPISLAYYFIGRFIIAKTFITNEKCDNCGLCWKQCPTHSIVLNNNRPFWKISCESCMKCMNYCPQRAIETAHSFFFILLFAMIFLLNPLLSQLVGAVTDKYMAGSGFASEVIYMILQWGSYLIVYIAGYRLIHYLARYRAFSKLITYTSFTYWKFWRRYKAPGRRRE